MKQMTLNLLSLFLAATVAEAADVKLQSLRDFDSGAHRMAVNVQVEVKEGCVVDPKDLEKTFAGLLDVFGLRIAPVNDSELEFAVLVKGFYQPDSQTCGIKMLSMVRQIPRIKMLRISPGSSSERYRLWTSDNILMADRDDIQPLLRAQARKDVTAFVRTLGE